MFGKLGTGELLVILVIALVIFGPSRLPALGKMAGKAIGSFRHYVNSAENWDLEEEMNPPPAATAASKQEGATQQAQETADTEAEEGARTQATA